MSKPIAKQQRAEDAVHSMRVWLAGVPALRRAQRSALFDGVGVLLANRYPDSEAEALRADLDSSVEPSVDSASADISDDVREMVGDTCANEFAESEERAILEQVAQLRALLGCELPARFHCSACCTMVPETERAPSGAEPMDLCQDCAGQMRARIIEIDEWLALNHCAGFGRLGFDADERGELLDERAWLARRIIDAPAEPSAEQRAEIRARELASAEEQRTRRRHERAELEARIANIDDALSELSFRIGAIEAQQRRAEQP